MKYVVVEFGSDCPHCEGDDTFDECVEVPDVYSLHACETNAEVAKKIASFDKSARRDWAVFEVTKKGFQRRALQHPGDPERQVIS